MQLSARFLNVSDSNLFGSQFRSEPANSVNERLHSPQRVTLAPIVPPLPGMINGELAILVQLGEHHLREFYQIAR